MMLARQSLGIIPDWQFSTDPTVNPNVNPNVTYPPGWNQLTRQPVGPAYAPPVEGMGLGDVWASFGDAVCDQSFLCRNKMWFMLGGAALVGMAIVGFRR